MWHEFIPKSYTALRSGYSFQTFQKDLLAGITVGVIALPLAMAFAISSGVEPQRGLFTAIIAGFLISALGGSKVQIGGPTGAFVVIIYGIIQRTGYEGLALSTLIAAFLLILLGLARIGSWVKYVPYPLVTGFTTGIALIIFSSQVKDFLGLNMGTPPAPFIEKWMAYIEALPSFHLPAALLGSGTFLTIIAIRKWFPKLPWGIGAIVLATTISYFFDLPVETIQSKFGEIPNHLPLPSLPSFHISQDRIPELMIDGIAIAFLAAIESLLCAVIADGMMGTRHRPNCELIGQGIANFASILFGGIPATGAIARTVANIKNGAATPLSGMIHAATILFILLFLAPIVSLIPLSALSAVLVMVAWNMSEAPHFFRLLKARLPDVAVLLTSFLLTIFVDITAAIIVGMVLASLFFMKQMSEHLKPAEKNVALETEIYPLQGPLFFGAADSVKNVLSHFKKPPKVLILKMDDVPFIDASGIQALKELHHTCQKNETTLLLSGLKKHIEHDLERWKVGFRYNR